MVSLTVTPALASLLLVRSRSLGERQPWLMRGLIRGYRPALRWAVDHPFLVSFAAMLALVGSLSLVPTLGRTFMPAFNEGALTVAVASLPGVPSAFV